MAEKDQTGSLFRDAGYELPGAAPVQSGSLFGDAGFALPGQRAPAAAAPAVDMPAGAVDYVEMPHTRHRIYLDKDGKPLAPKDQYVKPSMGERLREFSRATTPEHVAIESARDIREKTAKSYADAVALAGSGVKDLRAGNYLPSFPEGDPRTWSGGGLLKTAVGSLGVPLSPLSGTIESGSGLLTRATGNKEFGERAGLLANVLLPTKGAATANQTMATTKALNRLVTAIGPENVPEAVSRLRANPRLTLMDVSDPVRVRAQGLIDPAQPHAQIILSDAVKNRIASAPSAVNSAYTEAMGSAPDVVKMVDALKESARAAGREAIAPALAKAKPVDVSPVIAAIDKELKPGITALMDPGTRLPLSDLQAELVRFKSQLTDGRNVVFDPDKLHTIQSNVGDMAFQLSKSSDSKQRMLGSQLRKFNEKLIDQIDEAASGAYRPARAKFKDAKDIHEAFDAGFDTLKNRAGVSGLEDRPEAIRKWVKDATPDELLARQLGTRADIDQKLRGVKNQTLAGTNITGIEYNREKLEALFGKKESSRLVRVMEDMQAEAATNARILTGSKTAETLAGQKAMEVRKIGGGNPLNYFAPAAVEMLGQGVGLPGVGAASVMALQGLHRGAQYIGKRSDIARNIAFARAASATGPIREDAINALLSHPKVIRELQKTGNALVVP